MDPYNNISALPKIYPTGYPQWDIYNVLLNAFCPFRGIEVDGKKLDRATFQNDINNINYITITGESIRDNQKYILVILNKNQKGNNAIISQKQELIMFINKVVKQGYQTIAIAPSPVKKKILSYLDESKITSDVLRFVHYDTFKIVKLLGPYSPQNYEITDASYFNQFYKKIEFQSKISVNSVDAIWMNAKVGQVLKSIDVDVSTGLRITPKLVVH